jgi:hypothetical protein
MKICDLNTNDQADDMAPLGAVLRTVLSPPLLKHLRHCRICKLPSDIPRWTWWQSMSAREKEEQKKGCEDHRLEHGRVVKDMRFPSFYVSLRNNHILRYHRIDSPASSQLVR